MKPSSKPKAMIEGVPTLRISNDSITRLRQMLSCGELEGVSPEFQRIWEAATGLRYHCGAGSAWPGTEFSVNLIVLAALQGVPLKCVNRCEECNMLFSVDDSNAPITPCKRCTEQDPAAQERVSAGKNKEPAPA